VTRRDLLGAPAALLPAQRAVRRPNLILLLVDDMGWGDPSCFGNPVMETPNLDRLAAQGLRFNNFYAASAVCSPSRAAILTGRYPLRFDIRQHFRDDEAHLPLTATLPKLLNAAGYATGHVGKWHLGGLHLKHIRDRASSIPGPHQHGFDHYLCQNEEPPLRTRLNAARMLFRKGGTCLIRDERPVEESDPYFHRHFTDITGEETVRLIDQFHKAGKPFFLNVWWLAPHKPYEPSPEPFWSRAAAAGIREDQRCYRSMVLHLDHRIGGILARLDELGIRDNTLVLFTSDNGGAYEANLGPWRGGKTDLHEGGIRVPAIASWPSRIPAGRATTAVGHHCDILPTFCAAAGVRTPADPALDGINLLPLLEGGAAPARGAMHWQIDLYRTLQRHYPKPEPFATEAARQGPWKLLSMDGRPVALYHLEADPGESRNLLEKEPQVVERLRQATQAYLTAARDRRGFQETTQ
jgi:arylsulfatase A-like enzyme